MHGQYTATTVAAAFWAGMFRPVDRAGAARLGFRIAPDDIAMGAEDPDAGWWAVLILGRGSILAITQDGTAVEVALDGVLLGERHHRLQCAASADGFTLGMVAAE